MPRISLVDALPIAQALEPQLSLDTTIVLTEQRDSLYWRWSSKGTYTASSTYNIMMSGGMVAWEHKETWRSRVPNTVRIFIYLMLRQRILTHDIMQRRRIGCEGKCVLCDSCPLETLIHLLFTCPYATQVWTFVSAELNIPLLKPMETAESTWSESWKIESRQPNLKKEDRMRWFKCTCWLIWKERNGMIFRGKARWPRELAQAIMQEGKLWARYC